MRQRHDDQVIGAIRLALSAPNQTVSTAVSVVNGIRSGNNDTNKGSNFTSKEKQKVIDANKQKNNGDVKCENCGTITTTPQKSEKGVTPPRTDRQVDHVIPKAKGGQGKAENGQILCRDCNRQKSDKLPK